MLLREQDPARQAFKLTLWGHVIFRAGQWACANFLRLRQCDYILKLFRHAVVRSEGWEFAHLISERIAHFLFKNERFAQKNVRFTHLLIFGEQNERFAHIAHQKRGNEQK